MCRKHSDPKVAAELAALHAALLVASPTRAAAAHYTAQQILHTVSNLAIEVPVNPATQDGADAGDPRGDGLTGDKGLHAQLASISSCIAALHKVVAHHADAAVCLIIWQQLVPLAAPTGQCRTASYP